MAKRAIQPEGLHKPAYYSQVVVAGNTVYLAGQTAVDAQGQVVGKGDAAAQAEQIFQNLQRALAAAGGGLEHIVKLTTYITDLAYREGYNQVRQRYLKPPMPASTLVVVKGLAHPDYLLEIEAVAVLD